MVRLTLISAATLILLALTTTSTSAATAQDWKSRSVYQIMTDRFAVGNNTANPGTCDGPRRFEYCGGTWNGIKDKLSYIKNMGFDAIWISPTVKNTPGGYHGYWAYDMYDVNERYGTKQDLKSLIAEAHKQGIYVMADVVANHMGPNNDVTTFPAPFNHYPADYHPFQIITQEDYNSNPTNVENKCIGDPKTGSLLPDLNTENPTVKNELNKWVGWLVKEYGFDGIRIDTVKHVPRAFWPDFVKSAGVYSIGEVFSQNKDQLASYKSTMDGLLNFPFYGLCQGIFGLRQSMWAVESYLTEMRQKFGQEKLNLLGSFVDNHDVPRFLNSQPDRTLLRNALTLAMFTDGIPFVWQGTEQEYTGGADPENREPLWYANYKNTPTTTLLSALNKVRTSAGAAFQQSVHKPIWTDDNFHAFTRGPILVLTTNVGSGGRIDKSLPSPYPDGTTLVNAVNPNERITVSGGKINVSLTNGEPKVYWQGQGVKAARALVKRQRIY